MVGVAVGFYTKKYSKKWYRFFSRFFFGTLKHEYKRVLYNVVRNMAKVFVDLISKPSDMGMGVAVGFYTQK